MVPLFAEKFTAFWDALGKAEEKDGVLYLPGNNFWRGEERLGSSLVVRECYKDLWNLVHQQYQDQNYLGGTAILGNPGIGKTVFQDYMLWQLRKIGATVVLKTRGEATYFLLSQKGAYFATSSMEDYDIANALYTKGTWFLVDGELPPFKQSFTVLTSSPRRDNYKEFLKQIGVTSLWMPMWSWDELQKLHTLKYSNINVNDLISLYEKWGGVPRYVLEKANDPGAQLELDNAIVACDLDAVTRCVGEFDASETVSHKIIHNIVGKDYIHRHIDWASEYVAKRVAEEHLKNQEQKLQTFLVASEGKGPYGALRGIMFEVYAHKILQKGGSFKMKCLHDPQNNIQVGPAPNLQIPPQQEISIKLAADIQKLQMNQYGRPESKIFPTIDAVMLPNIFFQFTVAHKHGVKKKYITGGANTIIAQLQQNPSNPSPPTEYKLIFVVPPDIYPSFGKQNFIGTKKQIVQDPSNVIQYALELPLL